MIWSTPVATLAQHNRSFQRSGMLRKTTILPAALKNERNVDIDPVTYFEIPSGVHKIGKLVVPFANIANSGVLNPSEPAIYGVTSRPDAGTKAITEVRSQEAHVIAEDLALRRGLYTPYARVGAELLISSMIPPSYKEAYVSDRVAHLQAMQAEAETGADGLRAGGGKFIVDELSLAIDALTRVDPTE